MNWVEFWSEALADLLSDKNLVIFALVIVALAIIGAKDLTQLQAQLLNSIISGLLGIAVGRRLPVSTGIGGKK